MISNKIGRSNGQSMPASSVNSQQPIQRTSDCFQ